MPDTGAPWNIPYVAGTDLVSDWPTDSQALANAIASGLDAASPIVQVVVASDTTDRTTTSTSFVTGTITASITPTSASNYIYVWWYAEASASRALNDESTSASFRITQGGSAVTGAESVTISRRAAATNPAVIAVPIALFGRFDPTDTSALTFLGEFKADLSSTTASLVNSSSTGHMILMEVAE